MDTRPAHELTGKFAWRLCNSEPAANGLTAARM
jgi:hypothetical protein